MRKKELDKLCNKFNIKIDLDKELHFKQLMKIRTQDPKFYYEFKKKRTFMLKEKEPKKKEHYHVTYLRQ